MANRKVSKRPKAKAMLRLPDLEQSKNAVLHSLAAASSQESYGHAINEFIAWYCSEPRLAFNRTVVLRYRFFLEQKKLAPSTINVRLAAVRRLAYEASDTGLLSPELAAGIRRVKGTKRLGVRIGNWLTVDQSRTLLCKPSSDNLRGKRDRAILALLKVPHASEVLPVEVFHPQGDHVFVAKIELVFQIVRRHHQPRRDAGRPLRGMVRAAQSLLERRPIDRKTEANQSMARIDQPRQIYLKQLTLRRLRLALGSHRFSPVFQAMGSAFWEILAQPIPRFIRFYRGLIGFSGSYFCVPGSPPNTRCPFPPACCTGSALSLGVGGDASPVDGTKFFQ